jgi:hypothetical protein
MRGTVFTQDVLQICVCGHLITQYAKSNPPSRQEFCTKCGGRTIDSCGACKTAIAVRHNSRFVYTHSVPKYCANCGQPYPWQRAAIENLTEVLRESELSVEEREEAIMTLPDIVRDTPKTESASLKMRRLLAKAGKPAYDVGIKVISDMASETTKKVMGLQ